MVILLCLSGAAAVLSGRQGDPGDGEWPGEVVEVTGWVRVAPAPFVETREGAVLVVGFNKRGARERLGGVAFATLRGTMLSRDGVRMLELSPGDDGVTPAPPGWGIPAAPIVAWERAGVETITGEITDPKCFLGAMKPGRGVTHRGCAAVCIAGGIPPVLVSSAPGAPGTRPRALILTGPDGAALEGDALGRLLTFVGERGVRVTGEVWRASGAPFEAMRIDVGALTRR